MFLVLSGWMYVSVKKYKLLFFVIILKREVELREFVLKFVSSSIEGIIGLLFFILIFAAASSDDVGTGVCIFLIGFSAISFIFWIFLCIIDIRETLQQIAENTSKIAITQGLLAQEMQKKCLGEEVKVERNSKL